jgi:hypothetical protein
MSPREYLDAQEKADQRIWLKEAESCALINCKRTKLGKLRKTKQIRSVLDGKCRRDLKQSVYDYLRQRIGGDE